MSRKETTPKLSQCVGNTYEVVCKGEELHESYSFFGTLTEVTHIGVPLLVFDDGAFVVYANRMHYLERVE